MPELIFKNLATDKHNVLEIGSIEVAVTYPDGTPAAGASYELALAAPAPAGGAAPAAGDVRKGVLDAGGRLVETNIPTGATGTLKVGGAPIIAMSE